MIDLTIGCAVFQDLQGLKWTFQDLRLYHREAMPRCELVVVDNDPSGKDAGKIQHYLNWFRSGVDVVEARYIHAPNPVGTSAPRQRLFDEARGKAVLCIDSHIAFELGSIKRLLDYYDAHPDTRDLLSGPLLYDNLLRHAGSTGWADQWRGGMWGTWETNPLITQDEPFEIFACGLGAFSCRKEAWRGFNPNFRGFGGEECYIHEKFRMAGAKCLCLPWLLWWHRFNDEATIKYPLSQWHKVRNYVIGHTELGLPLDRMKKHFMEGIDEDTNRRGQEVNLFQQPEWDLLMQNPANPVEWPPQSVIAAAAAFAQPQPPIQQQPACGNCGNGQPMDASITLEHLYEKAAREVSDIYEHAPKLRELAAQCEHVTEFGMRHGVSTVAILAGQPKRFVTYDVNAIGVASDLKARQGACDFQFVQGSSLIVDIEPTDMLFIDTVHRADHFYAEVIKHFHKVRRWIAMHDTQIFGENGDGGGPGILPALRRFMTEHPEWSVIYHTQKNNGFTVISCSEADKPKLPGIATMAWNYAKALVKNIGTDYLSDEQGEERLKVCTTCPQRVGDQCSVCGCFLSAIPEGIPGAQPGPGRAFWKNSPCPLGFWDEVDKRFSLPIVS